MDAAVKQDRIRGCLIGGAAGDALGCPIEFMSEESIFEKYGPKGITSYSSGLISDDTQMTLFTANSMLYGFTRGELRDIGGHPSTYAEKSYCEWYATQTESFE